MNKIQNPNLEIAKDETVPSVATQIEVADLEPEQDVNGGVTRMNCSNNIRQMGIG